MRSLLLTVISCLVCFFLLPLLSPVSAADDPNKIFFGSGTDHIIDSTNVDKQAAEKGSPVIYHGNTAFYQMTDNMLIIPQMITHICADQDHCTRGYTAMQTMGSTIALLYDHPPASAVAWTRETLANAGILAKPAYAQGIGFAALSPFVPLWQAMRNIAYILLILVMIVIGFMIIFRMNIDPKTIISLQAALPKIILSIILITFSYPIVGFLVDLMYLIMGISVSIFIKAMPGQQLMGSDLATWQADMITGHTWVLLRTVMGGGYHSVDDIVKYWAIGAVGATGIGGTIGGLIAGGFGWQLILGLAAPAVLLLLILSLALLFVFLRILMLLANAYVQIIISLILGPILLLNEAIPGRSGFMDWIMNILSNLSVFPTTAIVLMFATYLTTSDVGGTWVPPFLPEAPSGSGQGFFGAFMGLSVIFLAPNLIAAVKKMFQAKPALPVSAGTIFSPVTGAGQTAMGAASQYYYFGQLWGSKDHPGILQQLTNRFSGGEGR